MTHQAVAKRSGFRLFRYVGDIIGELKKVVWLSRRETAHLTVVVLIVTAIAALALGALDLGFTGIVDNFFLGR